MNRIYHIGLIILFSQIQYSEAQPTNSTPQQDNFFLVGDTVRNITFRNLINYPFKTVNVLEFKGKLLILDFWSSSCASCIQSWPKLMELQSKYSGKIQILLLNPWEDETRIRNVIGKREKLTGMKLTLPTTCKDDNLLAVFKVSGLPQINWIDADGVLRSVTSGSLLTTTNIEKMLVGSGNSLQQKVHPDEYIDVKFLEPLFVNGNGGAVETVMSQSILTKGGQRILGQTGLIDSPAPQRSLINALNVDVKNLYAWAYSNRNNTDGVLTLLPSNRVIFNVKDSAKYKYTIDGVVQYDNLFNYQYITVNGTRKSLQDRMQFDLMNYFNFNVEWKQIKKKCLVISASDTSAIAYKEGGARYAISEGIKFNKLSVKDLIKHLEDDTDFHSSPYPILDETGFKGLLGEFELNVDGYGSDFSRLNRELRKYKMSITLQERYVEVLVITDKSD